MIHINYFRNNKGKMISIMSIIVLAILCISFVVTATTSSIKATETAALIEPFRRFTAIVPSSENAVLQEEFITSVDSNQQVEEAWNCYIQLIHMDTLFGTMDTMSFFLNEEKGVSKLMESCNLQVAEGVLPKESHDDSEDYVYELAMHERLLENYGYQVGDYIWLDDGYYKIVGSLSGDSIISLGTRSRFVDQYQLSGVITTYLAFPKESIEKMNDALLSDIEQICKDTGENVSRYTLDDQVRMVQEEFETASMFLLWIYVVVILIISLSLCMFIYNIYNARIDEFAILCAIGYRKQQITKMILSELAYVSFFGWVIGYGLSFLLLSALRAILFTPKGLIMPLFSWSALWICLALPIVVLLITVFTVTRKLSKQDLISLIR